MTSPLLQPSPPVTSRLTAFWQPPGGWNRHWDGPDRDIDQGRFDHQPFNYYGYQAVPIWSPDMGG